MKDMKDSRSLELKVGINNENRLTILKLEKYLLESLGDQKVEDHYKKNFPFGEIVKEYMKEDSDNYICEVEKIKMRINDKGEIIEVMIIRPDLEEIVRRYYPERDRGIGYYRSSRNSFEVECNSFREVNRWMSVYKKSKVGGVESYYSLDGSWWGKLGNLVKMMSGRVKRYRKLFENYLLKRSRESEELLSRISKMYE